MYSFSKTDSIKQQVHKFWNANPCGSKFVNLNFGTKEFFDSIEFHRYSTEWHIKSVVDFPFWKGKKVLEIGCGLGTDALQFARTGADYLGIDLTETAVETTAKRFQLYEVKGATAVADAENLPFEDNSFDLVYSHGVLHHTPNTERAITEVHRVLRPSGKAMIMLYHKNSYNYYGNIMFFRRLGSQLLRFSWGPSLVNYITGEDIERLKELQQKMRCDSKKFFSPSEFLNQNTDGAGNPLAHAYTRKEALKMFTMFKESKTQIHFLNKRWIPVLGSVMPHSLEARLASYIGWHLWIIAYKA